jgi:replicative DNA helicase
MSGPDKLPYNAEAEEHVLAAALVDGKETVERMLAGGLVAESFYLPQNAALFTEILELYRREPPVTLEKLWVHLQTKGLADAVGGLPYLMQITGPVPTTAHAGYFIDKVRELAARRWLQRESDRLAREALDPNQPVADLMQRHLNAMGRGLGRVLRREQLPIGLAEQCDRVAHEFATRREGKEDRRGWIHTGMPVFDQRLLPFGCQFADHLVVLGGGSGDGKSTLAIQWAGVALDNGQRVRAYTKETGAAVFLMTLAAQRARVDMRRPRETLEENFKRFLADCEKMKKEWADTRLTCVEQTGATPLATIEDLEDDARMYHRLQGGADLWLVDYAQIFGTRKRCNSREEINAHVAGKLQQLCRELGGVWLVLVQLNEKGLAEMRQIHRDKDGKVIHRMPHRGDLRESQAYYHAADRVLFIYRPPVDCRDQEQTSPAVLKPEQWIVQDKRRRGGRGYIRCWFEMIYGTFEAFPLNHADPAAAPGRMTKTQWKHEKGDKR